MKSLGILGGMGPLASAEFLKLVLSNFHVENDAEYPRIILDSNTTIPSRSRAFLYKEPSPVPEMIKACQQLESYGIDYLAIPCNSAQAWLEEIKTALSTPILDIRQITVRALQKDFPECKRAIVLGGPVTYGMETYKAYFQEHGIEYLRISVDDQKIVEEIIYSCKKNRPLEAIEKNYQCLLETLAQKWGADCAVVLGCTEFSLLNKGPATQVIIDSTQAYADYTAAILAGEVRE